jgi:phage gpG-like protein
MSKSPLTVVNLTEFQGQLKRLQTAARGEAVKRAALAGGHVIEAYAKINVEKTFSGKSTGGAGLGGSIQTEVTKSTANSAEVSVGPTVVYGRIQELGGIIKPVHAKMLSWVEDGVRIFANLVRIPPRPYLRPAADEHENEIREAVGESLREDIRRAM